MILYIIMTFFPLILGSLCGLACSIFYQRYYRTFFSKTAEDSYQLDRRTVSKHGNGSLIHIKLNFKDENTFSLMLSNIYGKLLSYDEEYMYHQTFTGDISDLETIDPPVFYSKEKYDSCSLFRYKFYVNTKEQSIQCVVKHEYIGGSHLLKLFYCVLQKYQNTNYLFPYSEIYHCMFIPQLLWYLFRKPTLLNPLPMITQDSEIKRYKTFYKEDYNSLKISSKTTILFNLLSNIRRALDKTEPLNRDLEVYMPIAFQPAIGINNNIGLIWISFSETDTVESLHKKICENKWQALATNSCLHILPNLPAIFSLPKLGESIRKNIDVVVTFMIAQDDTEFEAYWTFEHVSHYPIYVAIASVMNSDSELMITQTITSSTENLTLENLNDTSVCHKYKDVEKFF